jgi:hypothetical protein
MTAISALQPFQERSPQLESVAMRLTAEQLACLSRCAKGISLRFATSDVVNALVAGGYSQMGLARVVTMTARGREYLQDMRADLLSAEVHHFSPAMPIGF